MMKIRREGVKFSITDIGQRNIWQSRLLLFDSGSGSISLDRRIFEAKTVDVSELVDLEQTFIDSLTRFLRFVNSIVHNKGKMVHKLSYTC